MNNVFHNPMFADDSMYYLQHGSPLIDAGNPAILDQDGSRSDIGWTGGPGGSVYEYMELPPDSPDTLLATCDDNTVTLTWPGSHEADLAGYRVYRSTFPDFYSPEVFPQYTLGPSDTTVVDTFCPSAVHVYYVVTAFDTVGMESDPSPEAAIHMTGILEESDQQNPLPRTPGIIAAYPNPFNASTTIEYYIPDIGARPAAVRLCIFDALGRKVATIVDGRQYPGYHRTIWDGSTGTGQSVASGLYFARLDLWGYDFVSPVKLVLQK